MHDDGTILNFCNHFWGKDERGVDVLFGRMNEAKNICEEIRMFYKDWATIEEEYARRLRRLVRGTLGSHEIGTMRESFDILQKETETIAKQHSNVALQIRGELEEPLHAFSTDMRTNRKTIQSNLEKLRRIKIAQENQVQKCKEKIEDKSGKSSGQTSQLSLFLGKSSEKNNQKVDKSQIMAQNNNDYLLAITVLQETSIKWIREWKIACDKFQDLEERRLNFIKSSLWTFSGIISETCVSDNKSCQKIRESIKNCNTQNDIQLFIRTKGTGQEIPNPPKSKDPNNIRFEDLNDPTCSIAQFSRVSDPQFHSDVIMQRSIFNENSAYISPKISSYVSDSQPEPSSKTDSNKVPFDGITQLCKNGTLLDSSNTKGFSPSTSAYPHNSETQAGSPSFNYKNHDEKVSPIASKIKKNDRNSFNNNDKGLGYLSMEETTNEINQAGYRSTISYKNSSIKKNYDTAKSPLFERLKGMGVVSDPEIESIDPRANVMLNVGNNLFKVETNERKKRPDIHSPEDPIVTALNQFKVSSKTSPKREPRVSWHDPIDDNDIRDPEIMDRRHCFPIEPQKPPSNIRSSIPIPQKPALSIPNRFVKLDPLSSSPSSMTATKIKHMSHAYTKQANDIYSTSEKDIYYPQYRTMPMNNNGICYGQVQENMFSEKEIMPMARGKNHNTGLCSPENMRLPVASEKPYMDYRRALRASSPQLEYRTISPENDYPRSGSRSPIVYKSTPPGAYPSRIGRPMESFQDDSISRPLTFRPTTENPDHFYNRVSRRQPPVSSPFDISLDADGNLINKYSRARSASPCPSSYRAISRSKYNMHTEHIPYSTSIPSGYRDYYNNDARMFNAPLSHNDRKMHMNNGLSPSQYTDDGKRILFYVRALYDYMATIPEEISFVKNDILLVLDMQEDGWWEGEVLNSKKSKRGLFPSNFVQRTTLIS